MTKQHILLVEDEQRLATLMTRYLEKSDFNVTVCSVHIPA